MHFPEGGRLIEVELLFSITTVLFSFKMLRWSGSPSPGMGGEWMQGEFYQRGKYLLPASKLQWYDETSIAQVSVLLILFFLWLQTAITLFFSVKLHQLVFFWVTIISLSISVLNKHSGGLFVPGAHPSATLLRYATLRWICVSSV